MVNNFEVLHLVQSKWLDISDNWMTEIDRNISVRVYSDSKPHNLDVGSLQKGLILLQDGIELIEEGMGFGVPVIYYDDRCYFSSDANTVVFDHGEEKVIEKTFQINSVLRKQIFGGPYIENMLYNPLSRYFIEVYRRGGIRSQFIFIMRLMRLLKINTRFIRMKTKGEVKFTYRISCKRINVEVDFARIEKARCKSIIILNEQGASFFRKYQDSSGVILQDDEIDSWKKVNSSVASFSDIYNNIAFELDKPANSGLFSGREAVTGRLAWSGLNYVLDSSLNRFSYSIKIK